MKTFDYTQHKQLNNVTIGVLGSHSALDVCHGAKDLGFKTMVICQKGREKTYTDYYRARNNIHPELARLPVRQVSGSQSKFNETSHNDIYIGCVDECIVLDNFSEILNADIQRKLLQKNSIFVPHRSFEAYLNFNYQAIEKQFKVPMFGNKFLLKIEERGTRPNQYDLMDEAGIHYPKQFKNPRDIDRLVLVKVSEEERKFERAFFLANSYADFKKQTELKLKKGVFTKSQLAEGVIEEFIIGVQVNLNFFYSKVHERMELIGTDTRRQTNLEGMNRIPAQFQEKVFESLAISYEEAGHVAVTILESLLDKAYDLGEKFVRATQKLYPPGIIGPFGLQTVITPGPPKKEFITFDISPRMPGSPGIAATPYSRYMFGKSVSMGERVAMEIKEALELNKLSNLIT